MVVPEIRRHSDYERLVASLVDLEKAGPKIAPKISRVILSKAKPHIRRGIRAKLRRRTGATLKSLKHKVKKDGSGVLWMAEKSAYVQEMGATIFPKKGRFLYFTTDDGQLRRVRSVTLKPKDFFYSSMESYLGSGEPMRHANDKLQKEIDRVWNRR